MPSIIKSSSVRATGPAPAAGAPRPRRCEKGVELLREDGVVRALQITCSCGETTVVELRYAEPSAAAPAGPTPEAPA